MDNTVLAVSIQSPTVLQAAYMPFLQGGGLFIPTYRTVPIGAEISMLLTLMGEPHRAVVTGIVVWITPKGAESNRAPGIGLQFKGEEGKSLQAKIKSYLADSIATTPCNRMTHTL